MARILIVDDSPLARQLLSRIIISLGHTVVGEGRSGAEACEEYAKLKPDVVTMDLTMAGSDGAQATSDIIAAFPEACIVVVSASQECQVIFDSLERGARHFLVKPVSPEKVAEVLNHVLQQPFDKEKHLALVRSMKAVCAAQEAKGNARRGDGKKISARVLIVDDSAVARKCLREILTALGHVVIGEAANGAQAFVEYTKLKPDVVTMDLTMQGLGGAEATSKIIAADPQARIIVISAMESRQGIIDALKRGARHFIIKPIQPETVAVVFHNVLQQEFEPHKHMDRVNRLKEADASQSLTGNDGGACLPPYAISVQDNHLVYVVINQTLTLISCQSLFQELEEYLNDTPRVLFDFGLMAKLDSPLLVKFNELIEIIKANSGMVKAISNNKMFVDSVSRMQPENQANLLADTLRYFEN